MIFCQYLFSWAMPHENTMGVGEVGSGHANYLTWSYIHHKIKPFWALEAPFRGKNHRFKKRTQIIAVGDKSFVKKVKEQLRFRSKGKIIKEADGYQLRDGQTRCGNWYYL